MRGGWWRTVAAMLAVGVLTCAAVPAARAQTNDELEALRKQVTDLYAAGKYGEAIPLFERFVVLTKSRYGDKSPELTTAFNNLALLYYAQGDYASYFNKGGDKIKGPSLSVGYRL